MNMRDWLNKRRRIWAFEMEKERSLLIIMVLFGGALAVRWIAITQNPVIANDASLYIKSARFYSIGAYLEGFNVFPRSFFPLFIAFSHKIFGDWVLAGQWVCTLFGALTVIPLYLLARQIFDEKVALLAAIFYIICPHLVRDSAEVLRDIPFIFFYTTALWLGYKGIKEKKAGVLGLASLFIFLSASIKDYGFTVFISFMLFLCWCVFKSEIPWRKALSLCTIFLAVAIFIFSFSWIILDKKGINIYPSTIARANTVLISIKAQTTRLEKEIENKEISAQAKRLFGITMQHRFALYSFHIFDKTMHAFNFLLFLLFMFGLIKRRKIKYRSGEFLLLTIYVAYIPLFLLHLNASYFLQTKNTFPLVVPSLIWSGVGFVELKERIIRWMKPRDFPLKAYVVRWLTPLLLLVICVPLLAMAWAPYRKSKLELKEIGLWLRDHGYAHSVIVGQYEFARLAFYADGEFIELSKGSYQDTIRFAREKEGDLLVINQKTIDHLSPGFLEKVSPRDLQRIDIRGIKTPKYTTTVFLVKECGKKE
jgi:4-amino-4-deoxy-L-arabinose transferase-like glycosyltransferase